MDPNAALARLLELFGSVADDLLREPRDTTEALADRTEELQNLITEARELFLGLHAWLGEKRGFRPAEWQHDTHARAIRGRLQDSNEVLERQGERWWDDTVTASLHHRWVAEDLVGQERSVGLADGESEA